jgi:hypothetical protein
MGIFALNVGGHIETTTPKELHSALLDQDARLMADVAGVKWGELFIPSGVIAGAQTFSNQPGQYSPSSGYLWAVMNVGLELSVSSQVRVYKGQPAFNAPGGITPSGNGRLITTAASFVTPSAQFSKGQFTLKGNDNWTLVMVTAGSILSIYMAYIEVPIEKQGELWL